MFLPIRAKNPPESFPILTICLIVANVLVYALTSQDFLQIKEPVLDKWGLKASEFDVVHMLTSMFLHGDLFHLLGNMWFLYLFGFAVEGRLLPHRFFLVYFLSGFAGDLLHFAILGQAYPDVPSIGASGAIMGVVGAGLFMFPHATITVFYRFIVWGTTDWPLWGVALFYLGFDAVYAVLGASDGVGHFAHLGGAAGGFLLAFLLRGKRDSADASAAKATLADTKDYSVLSPLEFQSLTKSQPDNTLIAVHWVQRGFRTHGGPSAESISHFNRLLPRILQEQDPLVVGSTLQMIAINPGAVPPHYLLSVAMRCEQAGDSRTALNLYDMALKDPATNPGDREAALFRSAIAVERVFGDRQRAVQIYQNFLSQYPLSPMAEQAKTRIRNLTQGV